MTTLEAVEAKHESGAAAGPGKEPGPRFGFGTTANTLLGYTLIKGLQLTLHNLIFPLYAYSLGYDQEAIGRLNATGALMVFIASVPIGMLADRVGRARLLAIGGLVTPLAMAGLALSQSLPALIAWFLLQNGLSVIYWSATSPLLIGSVSPERRVRAFSINSFFLWGVGAIGSAIGGFVAASAARVMGISSHDTAALRVALLFNAGLALVGGLPLWRIRNVEAASDGGAGRARLGLAELRLFGRLLLPDALQACGAGAVIGFLPLFFALRFGLEPGILGWIFTITGVLGGISALSAPTIARRLGERRAIGGLMGGVAACMVLTVAAPFLAGAIIFEGLRAAVRGTIDPIYTSYAMSQAAPERRGTLAGLYNVTYATGFSLGPLISGWLQVHYGFGPAFAMGAGLYLLAALSIWLLWGKMGTEGGARGLAAAEAPAD